MDQLEEYEAREKLSQVCRCEDATADDWVFLDRPEGAFSFEQGLVDLQGNNVGMFVQLIFYRSKETGLLTVKMSVFQQTKRQPRMRVYQLQITTKSYDPDNWHDEAHEHFGKGREIVPEWKQWRSFQDVLDFFCLRTNIEFLPPLEDPEQLRLK